MNKMLLIIIILMLMMPAGCSKNISSEKNGEDLTLIWPIKEKGLFVKKINLGIETVKSPNGFKILPAEVLEKCSPRKYIVTIYADNTFYYLVKDMGNSKAAKQFGIKVNGRTGEVLFPKNANRYTPLHYEGISSKNTPHPMPLP